MYILSLILSAVLAYFIGGFNGAIIASSSFFKRDVRKYGSGNAGLTNFYRVFGEKGLVVVIVVDMLKAVAGVFIGLWLLDTYFSETFCKVYAGFFVMLGHVFPVYYKFHGGKGVLVAGTVTLLLDWRIGLIAWGAFLIFVVCTRYVSLGSIMAAIAFLITTACMHYSFPVIIITAMISALLIGKHSENILRLIKGTESRFSFRHK